MRYFTIVMIFPCLLAAIEQGPETRRQEVIRAVTQEVLLDVVVRDHKGRLIRDLRPEEIEVYDDGVRQKLTSFRLVTGSDVAGLGSEAPSSPKRLDPMRHLRLVSLVYEGLDNEARRLARGASMDFLKDTLEQNLYVAVFVIGERLHVLQPFTNDLVQLRKAVERATTSPYPQFVAEAQAIRKQLEAMEAEGGAATEAVSTNIPGRGRSDTGGIAGASTSAIMAQMTLNMLNFEETLTRAQQSRSSLFSLVSLVKEQAALPGRKTVIYFTRGLEVPENTIELLKSTISAANRSGVSVYGVDARGLTLDAQNSSSTSMLRSAANASQRQQTVEGASVTPEQVRVFDTGLSSIQANTQQALGNLSVSTGGFLVANTNDFREPLQHVHEELLTYYEASYMPQITEYDGKFHRLSVKVNRPDTRVQSRSGYFALPANQDSLFTYEFPLLRALSLSPPPGDLSYYTGAVRLGQQGGKTRYSLVIEVPLKELKVTEEKDKRRYRTRFSFLVLLKDREGQIVERFSRDFPFEVPSDRLQEFSKRSFLQAYYVTLPPGRYTLESAIMDQEGEKTGIRRVSLMVLAPRPGIGISSISLVRRTDPGTAEPDPEDSFRFQNSRIVPTLENQVQFAPERGFSFYFVVYPSSTDSSKPQLLMELSKDGTPIGTARPDLPAANERSEIPYVASFPMANLQPGQYELRAVVRQGASSSEEKTVFTINP